MQVLYHNEVAGPTLPRRRYFRHQTHHSTSGLSLSSTTRLAGTPVIWYNKGQLFTADRLGRSHSIERGPQWTRFTRRSWHKPVHY